VLLRRANDQLAAFPRYVRLRRVLPTREAWSVDNGLLTPTLKLKRPLVMARLQAAIDEIYASAAKA
jgi:long-chain acyl-CoA synthetase